MKMSPSVLRSTGLFPLKNQDLKIPNKPEVKKVKRVLFGPVDHKATQKFLERELKKVIKDKSEEWNIDFKTGRTLRPGGIYDWKMATPRKTTPETVRRDLDVEMDISYQYCQLVDADLVRPRPVRCCSPEIKSHQSRITGMLKIALFKLTSYCETRLSQ